MANKEFEDTLEATEFMDTLFDMIMDPRLRDWAKCTDEMCSTSTSMFLQNARNEIKEFDNEMNVAAEL